MFECTNQYGEIILRQAFDQSRQQFNYDPQSEVYDSVRVICYRAINYLSMTGGGMNAANFANSDFYFNKGDLGRWIKFCHGILARSFAYIHNKSTYNADSVIFHANLAMTTNADNATAKFQSTGITGTSNYFGTARGNVNQTTSGIRQSAFIADLMSGANAFAFTGVADPRAWYMLRGNPNGTIKGYSPSYSTAINPVLGTADQPESFVGTAFGTVGYGAGEAGRYIFRDNAEFPMKCNSC
jgi:hypothetical protein